MPDFTLPMSPAVASSHKSTGGSSSSAIATPVSTEPTSEELPADYMDDEFPNPKLRLEIRDLKHPGAKRFLESVEAADALETGIASVLMLLYDSPTCPTTHATPTRSVTVVLRDMGGVAYTTGSDLDSDHKEIHFSLRFIEGISKGRLGEEITGVLVHELVHCLQWNGHNTCNGGLIEGVADWVRLRCGLDPPHWKRNLDGKWDAGYAPTAFFLDYLEDRFGEGTVRRLNEKLRVCEYKEKAFWTELVGRPVTQLWDDYRKEVKEIGEGIEEETPQDLKAKAK